MRHLNRELTAREKQAVKKLVRSTCANYDKEYGCLPLDSECYMFGICYTGSALCKYFRSSVLPEDPKLSAAFAGASTRNCRFCGKPFAEDRNRVYCSSRCAKEARKQQTAARVRKYRQNHKKG